MERDPSGNIDPYLQPAPPELLGRLQTTAEQLVEHRETVFGMYFTMHHAGISLAADFTTAPKYLADEQIWDYPKGLPQDREKTYPEKHFALSFTDGTHVLNILLPPDGKSLQYVSGPNTTTEENDEHTYPPSLEELGFDIPNSFDELPDLPSQKAGTEPVSKFQLFLLTEMVSSIISETKDSKRLNITRECIEAFNTINASLPREARTLTVPADESNVVEFMSMFQSIQDMRGLAGSFVKQSVLKQPVVFSSGLQAVTANVASNTLIDSSDKILERELIIHGLAANPNDAVYYIAYRLHFDELGVNYTQKQVPAAVALRAITRQRLNEQLSKKELTDTEHAEMMIELLGQYDEELDGDFDGLETSYEQLHSQQYQDIAEGFHAPTFGDCQDIEKVLARLR